MSQSYTNHRRFHWPFHCIGMPLLMLAVLGATFNIWLAWGRSESLSALLPHAVLWALAVGTFFTAPMSRVYGLKVQDRVICLEVGERYARVTGGEPFHALRERLSVAQIVALRFAGDGELAALAQRSANENLPSAAIKQAIREWRPDDYRV